MSTHTFVLYLEDRPGALNRVASLFRRRVFNIESLTVGHTEQPGVSRMTVVVEADDLSARRVEAQIYKLVDVLRVEDVTRALVTNTLRDVGGNRERASQMLGISTRTLYRKIRDYGLSRREPHAETAGSD